MPRRANPLVWVVAALAVFAGALWQQRASQGTSPTPAPGQTGKPAPAAPPVQTSRVEAEKSAEVPRQWARVRSAVPEGEQAQLLATLNLIARGGPFPYAKDGSVFSNREGALPRQPRGSYREYTVPTPGAPNRGARRVVQGKGGGTWYTNDHYRTFVRIDR